MRKLIIPPTICVYCALGMLLLYLFLPQFNTIPFPVNLIGIAIGFGGFWFMGKTRDTFRKNQTTFRIGLSSCLITEGVFSKTRNPMYLGMFTMVFGVGIFSTNLLSLLFPLIFLLYVRILFVAKEEQMLKDTFGKAYIDYKNRVPRWL